ncbi:MAG TPA: hypothetical protein VN445_12895 [Rectinemataceae bacterium]|nr:hypothetical protein [Rectinemataceae bacterium]
MKKLIVLLLAFAMVGAVSAQVTTAITLKGNVTIVDQAGNSVFAPKGNGYDTFTFSAKEKDGKYGFAMTDQNVLDGSFDTLRDWNVWAVGKFTKVIAGNLRNADFRLGQAYQGTDYLGATDRISGYGVLIETLPVNGLSFGVNLPIGTTAAQFTNVLQKADVGVKYTAKGFGTAFAMANLDLVTPATIINAGVNYNAIAKLPITLLFKGQVNANDYRASIGTDFTGVDKLDLYVEADVKLGAAVGYTVFAEGDYAVTDKLTGIVGAKYGDAGYDAYVEADYACLPGMTGIGVVGYDGALYAALKLYYEVAL